MYVRVVRIENNAPNPRSLSPYKSRLWLRLVSYHINLGSYLHNLQYQHRIDIAYFIRNVYVPFHLDFYLIVIPLVYINWKTMQIETKVVLFVKFWYSR